MVGTAIFKLLEVGMNVYDCFTIGNYLEGVSRIWATLLWYGNISMW